MSPQKHVIIMQCTILESEYVILLLINLLLSLNMYYSWDWICISTVNEFCSNSLFFVIGAIYIFGEIVKQVGNNKDLRPKPHIYFSIMIVFATSGGFDSVLKKRWFWHGKEIEQPHMARFLSKKTYGPIQVDLLVVQLNNRQMKY